MSGLNMGQRRLRPATTYVDFNNLVQFRALVEFDFQRGAVRLQAGQKLPFRCLPINLDVFDVQMAGIEENFLGFTISYRLQPVDDIPRKLLLVEKDFEIGRDMRG